MTRTLPRFRSVLALLLIHAGFGAVSPGSATAAITADSANDVCSASANPCIVSQQVIIVSGSVLDFGTRALRVQGSGFLDVGGGTARVRAGSITTQVSGTGIKLNE